MPLKAQLDQVQALVGQTIQDKYRVERLLGAGGMGAVYEALNLSINKRVALKFLFRDEVLDADTIARFQREAKAASAIDSAHIVQIFDAGTSEAGRPYLVMELLEGEDLRHQLKREGRLSLAMVLRIAMQLLRALERAHQAGIIHRDLKPENIFICQRDDDPLFAKIVDFGISKVVNDPSDTLTRRGTVLGTAHYMSPEQAQAYTDIDGRADLFSVGAILYEALAGRPPHTGKSYEAILIKACTTEAPPLREFAPEVPASVARVIAKAILRDRSQRYQSASDFYRALEAAAPTAGPAAVASTPPVRLAAPTAFADTEASNTAPPEPDTAETVPNQQAAQPPSAPTPRRRRRFVAIAAAALVGLALVVAMLAQRGPDPGAMSASHQLVPSAGARASVGKVPSAAAPRTAPTPSASIVSGQQARLPVQPAPSVRSDASPPAASPTDPMVKATPVTLPSASATLSPPAPTGVAGQLQLKTEGP